jgi:hypothetical protein
MLSLCVHPCFESYFQQGRLILKLAATQAEVEQAQEASAFDSSYFIYAHNTFIIILRNAAVDARYCCFV